MKTIITICLNYTLQNYVCVQVSGCGLILSCSELKLLKTVQRHFEATNVQPLI